MEIIGGQRWYALLVRSRCEKLAASGLAARGFEVFPAMVPQRRVWTDRVRTVDLPLFPGYIFARFNADTHQIQITRVAGVASVVRCGIRACPIDDAEIAGIQAILRSGHQIFGSPYFQVGARVRVVSGLLAGTYGILQKLKNRDRLILSITLLQRSVAVEIDEALVESLEPIRARSESRSVAMKGVV